jgi:hypothetical protein
MRPMILFACPVPRFPVFQPSEKEPRSKPELSVPLLPELYHPPAQAGTKSYRITPNQAI